ncbi:CCA tRNA nucleotidyltransferase [Dongia sedimenti]|uniref:CCA tRNA nucleotidyltransferase n=1 Tax=Dongia sedimenti TaxID=3064282 RepID=A0ABU0YQU1_9PROT|nr:CCA tRNA nucleotidyltransferase [Rhodospirillaceae bacterium R-7]
MTTDLGKFPQDWMTSGPAHKVYQALERAGGAPRFVGGCVRDGLLGRRIRDIDIATPLEPAAVMQAAEAAGLKHVPTGIDHGTVTVVADHTGIEVTTLRRDVETFGRHATVAFTDDWREDAARRDLTMNALSADASGKVYDYFDGITDLQAGKVRFVGAPEDRMREDYLRILRYFRFHADYATDGFDQPALAAARALKGELKSLSGERLRQETLKLLTARRGVETWRAMLAEGIVDAFLPQATTVDRMAKVAALESRLKVPQDAVRRLAALTVTGAGPAVAQTLRLSNAERDRVLAISAARPDFAVSDPVLVRRQVYDLGNALALDLLLVDWDQADIDWLNAFEIVRDWLRPEFPVRGRDLSALGIAAGPEIGRLLKELEEWWIAGDFAADREHALAELRRRIGGKR